MKKEEAAGKWCPFARGLWLTSMWVENEGKTVQEYQVCNRLENPNIPENCVCITDRCMAWEMWPEAKDGSEGYCNLMDK